MQERAEAGEDCVSANTNLLNETLSSILDLLNLRLSR